MAGLAASLGSGAMTNSISDIRHADVLLVTGSNTTEAHPVISLEMKAAIRRNGAKLILIDPREIELADFATLHLRPRSGTDVAVLNSMAHVMIVEGLAGSGVHRLPHRKFRRPLRCGQALHPAMGGRYFRRARQL